MRAWASAQPCGRAPAATQEQIERHLEFVAATLPSRAIDDESGKRRFAVYVSLLGGLPNEALAHMARRACETLDWFPTPKQCLELAGEYVAPQSEAEKALGDCDAFDQRVFDAWIASLPNNDDPDLGVPKRWLEIALTRALLRKLDDGTVVTRARYRQVMANAA